MENFNKKREILIGSLLLLLFSVLLVGNIASTKPDQQQEREKTETRHTHMSLRIFHHM